MKYLCLSIFLLLSNFSFAQQSKTLFERIMSPDILSEADLIDIPTEAPYIVGKIDPSVLSSQNIKFTSFYGEEVVLNKIKTEKQINAVIWIGKIENNSIGNTYLSFVEESVWGKVENNDGTQIMIRPLPSNNQYVIMYETTMGYQKEDCDDEQTLIIDTQPDSDSDSFEYTEFDTTDICDPTAVCSNDIVDLLIVYNITAKVNFGGSTAAAEAAIGMAVAEMNTINLNSGNGTKVFNLAGVEEINYNESGSFSTDLSRLRVDDDSFMDEVLDLRDEVYADVVSLIVGSGGCGLGNVNTNNLQYESQAGFSVCSSICMTGNKTLAHEVGHNMGFRHDRYAYDSNPSIVCSDAWGWVNPNAFGGSDSQKWRTVMAYNAECFDQGFNCFRINNWSNPNVNYNADPTGSLTGNSDEANNSSILDRAFCQVGDFRVAPDCTDCDIVQECESYNSNTALGPGNTTDIQFISVFNQLDTTGSNAQVCIYYYGDNNNPSEQFNVLDENNNLLGTTVASYDCDIPNRICFDVIPSIFNSWIADGQVTISLDPISTAINPNLCSANRACVELIIPNTLNTEEFESKSTEINIFPNPSSDRIEISIDENLDEVSIFNLNGQLVLNKKGSKTIDISTLSKGVYILKLITQNSTYAKKLIKN